MGIFTKKLKDSSGEMTVMSHLDELRSRLRIVVIVNLIAAMVLFNFSDILMQYLLDLNPGMDLVYINPSELLLEYVQISFLAAFVLCSPITFYHCWAFIEKGLFKREKIYVFISLIFGLICFICGVFFCYIVVLPITLQFFMRIEISEVTAMISVQSYANFVNTMLLCFGVVFEMPVVVFLLTKLKILKPTLLKKHRGYIIIAIFIFAALITPPDVVSQIMLGVPMMILLEISIIICYLVDKTNKKLELKAEALQ